MIEAAHIPEDPVARRKYAQEAIRRFKKFEVRDNIVLVAFVILPFILFRLNLYIDMTGLTWLGPYWLYSIKSGRNVMFMQIVFLIPLMIYVAWSFVHLKKAEGWFFISVDLKDKDGKDFPAIKADHKKVAFVVGLVMLCGVLIFSYAIYIEDLGLGALFFSHGCLGLSLFFLRHFALAFFLKPEHRTLNTDVNIETLPGKDTEF